MSALPATSSPIAPEQREAPSRQLSRTGTALVGPQLFTKHEQTSPNTGRRPARGCTRLSMCR